MWPAVLMVSWGLYRSLAVTADFKEDQQICLKYAMILRISFWNIIKRSLLATALTVVLVAVGCRGSGSPSGIGPDAVAPTVSTTAVLSDSPNCNLSKLVVATSETTYPPFVIDNDPANQKGFEPAVVYAVAAQLGVDAASVSWVRTGLLDSVSAGSKDYDFNIQQFSITDDEQTGAVDFSESYYSSEQAVIAPADSSIRGATSLADLKSARLGTTALSAGGRSYINEVIQPDSQAREYIGPKLPFDSGQIDAMVVDLLTAYRITAGEKVAALINERLNENSLGDGYAGAGEGPDLSIIGALPRVGTAEYELRILFEKGSPLVSCINMALQSLKVSGELDAIEETWLKDGGAIPTLTR